MFANLRLNTRRFFLLRSAANFDRADLYQAEAEVKDIYGPLLAYLASASELPATPKGFGTWHGETELGIDAAPGASLESVPCSTQC